MRIRYVRSLENKWERSWRTVGMKREKKQFVHSFGSQIKSDFGERNVKQTPSFPFYSQINRDVISNKFPWISVTRFYSVFEWEEKGKKGWNSAAKNKNDSSLFFFNFFPMLSADRFAMNHKKVVHWDCERNNRINVWHCVSHLCTLDRHISREHEHFLWWFTNSPSWCMNKLCIW